MDDRGKQQSPWWYQRRGSLIGSIYGLGFVIGYLSFDDHPRQPTYIAWGDRFGAGNAGSTILWCAIVCALIAGFWRTWGTAYLHRNVVFASDVQSDSLVTSGPFRYVRNPLYLGNVFLALAAAVFAPPLGFIIIVAGNIAAGMALAAEEARQLRRRYGAAYEAFRAAVPGFVPRLTAADVPGAVAARPAWRSALIGESYCLALAIAIVPVALIGRAALPAFGIIWMSALIGFGIAGWWAGRPNRSKPVR